MMKLTARGEFFLFLNQCSVPFSLRKYHLPKGFLFNEPLFAKHVESELDNILEELSVGKIDNKSANAALKNYKKNEKIHDKAVKAIKKRMSEASKEVESELKESILALEKAEKIKGKQGELVVK